VRLFFGSCFALFLAAVIGLSATWLTVTRGVAFGSLKIGAWTAWPRSGSVDIDPYARAIIARSGELPIGTGDGVAFFARTDDAGNRFDGRCSFVLSGMTPSARYWTLTLYDQNGRLVANTIASRLMSDRGRGPATGYRAAASKISCWCCASTIPRSVSPR
jgi:hypothetical protein